MQDFAKFLVQFTSCMFCIYTKIKYFLILSHSVKEV